MARPGHAWAGGREDCGMRGDQRPVECPCPFCFNARIARREAERTNGWGDPDEPIPYELTDAGRKALGESR